MAFVARPVGSFYFGNLGDKIGRKRTLVIALILMGVATTLVGLLPGYDTIGVAAPIILVILRFVQGLAVGGQWGGAVLIATENATKNRRGYYGSFAQLGVPVAVIISNALFLLLLTGAISQAQFAAWGWRVPFLVSVLLIGVGLYAQLALEETVAFERVQRAHAEAHVPLLDALRTHPKEIALAAGAFILINGTFYILISYVLAYGEAIGIPSSTILVGIVISGFFGFAAILGFAALSDRIGRRGLYMAGAVLLGLWGFPLFWLINTKVVILIWIALVVGQIFLSMMYGPQAAFYSELFTARLRYSGASAGYQIGAIFGGGLASLIAAAIYAGTRSYVGISLYILLMAVISFVSVFLLTETYQRDVDDATGEGTAQG